MCYIRVAILSLLRLIKFISLLIEVFSNVSNHKYDLRRLSPGNAHT